MSDTESIRLVYDAFFAIAESVTSIVYINVSDQRTYPIRLDPYSKRYEAMLDTHPVFSDVFGRYVEDMVYKEDSQSLMRFADIDYVTGRLKKENPLLHVYRAFHNDRVAYFRLKVVPMEDGAKLIFGFENIDSEYRRRMKITAENERYHRLLDGLSREYLSVWYLDGKSRKVTLIRNNGSDSENGEPVRIGSTLVDYHFSMQKYFGSYVSPDDFDHLMDETSYESLVKNAGDDDLYYINYIRVNPNGERNHFQLCYAKITDDTGMANFVVGFRNIDSAMRR